MTAMVRLEFHRPGVRSAARTMQRAAFLVSLALLTVAGAAADAPRWADPAKTLRVMFPIAETGFDPAPSQDYYSGNINRLIFDALYEPDYLARPYRWTPNTATGMPEISKDGLTWTIRIKRGHPVCRRSCVQGEEARADRGGLRLFVEAPRRPEGTLAQRVLHRGQAGRGSTRRSRRRRRPASSTTTREIEGLKATDRYTIQLQLTEPDYTLLRVPDADHDGGGRARGRRSVRRREHLGDGEPGRHRPVPAEGVAARAEDHARGEPELSRRVLSGAASRRRRRLQGGCGPDEGQAPAADRPHRDLDHRGIESAAPRVQLGRARLRQRARRSRAQGARREQQASAALPEAKA